MHHQTERGEIGPNIAHLGKLEDAVKHQACENVGDLVGQHGRSVQPLADVQPAPQVSLSRILALVRDDHGDDNAGVDNDAHRRGSSATRASGASATTSPAGRC